MPQKVKKKIGEGHFWKDKSRKGKKDTRHLYSLPYHSELGGFVPIDYDISRHLEYNMHQIDEKIEELLENTETDQYNEASFLDDYIEARFHLVKNDLKRQGIRHKHIMNGLKIIREAQLTKIKNIRKALQETEKQCKENDD